jgi:hypothetical protein
MEQTFKSLTHRGVNGYKQSSISLCNSQTLAAELFLRNKWRKSIAPGCISSHRNVLPSGLVGLIDKAGPETEDGSHGAACDRKGKDPQFSLRTVCYPIHRALL